MPRPLHVYSPGAAAPTNGGDQGQLLLLRLHLCCCFQMILSICRLRCQVLDIFVDSFQGYYKNVTDGIRDCRYSQAYICSAGSDFAFICSVCVCF